MGKTYFASKSDRTEKEKSSHSSSNLSKNKFSVVVCTTGRPETVFDCVNSLLQNSYQNREIIVVAESERDVEKVRFLPVQLIFVENKKGLAHALNKGIEKASGNIIAFTDDDAIVDKEWISVLNSSYHEGVGGVGGPVCDLKTHDLIFEGGRLVRVPILLKGLMGLGIVNRHVSKGEICDVDVIVGANMSFRMDVLEKVGFFDEFYTFWCQELDICLRVKSQSCKIIYNPKAKVWHEKYDPLKKTSHWERSWYYLRNRNQLYFVLKNYMKNSPFRCALYLFFDLAWTVTLLLMLFLKSFTSAESRKECSDITIEVLRAHKDSLKAFRALRIARK